MSIKCGPKDTVPLEVIPAGITAREFMKLKMQSTDKEVLRILTNYSLITIYHRTMMIHFI